MSGGQKDPGTGAFELVAEGPGRYRLRGELSYATAAAALRATAEWFPADGDIYLDLGGIDRADSAGVALLIEWVRRAGSSGRIRFSHLPDSLRAIARVGGVEPFLPADP